MSDSERRSIRDFGFDDEDDQQEESANTPQVTWTLNLDDAEVLWDFLHRHRPGGYQHVHDGLLDAIAQTRRELSDVSPDPER